jgi:hypothetical protein
MKGIGRVTFIAHLAEITAELDAGWPLKAVYENRQGRLGISYAQFARYVDRIIRRDARGQAQPRPAAGSPPPPLARPHPEVPVVITPSESANHVGQRAAHTFSHDPIERPDDRRRLLGED